MMIYMLLAISPLFFGTMANIIYPEVDAGKKRRKFVLIITGICLFLIIALRNKRLGSADSLQYYNYWELLSKFSFQQFLAYAETSRLEIGFLFCTWLLSHIPWFYAPQFIFVFSGMVIVICYGKFIYQNCDNLVLGYTMLICLGLFTFMIQGLRQAVAMSICMVSIQYCKERKLLKFLVLILCASLFHQTAIIFLITYLIPKFRMNIQSLLIALVMLISVIIFSNRIISIANNFFGMEYGIPVESGGFVALSIYIIILICGWIFAGKYRDDADYNFFFYLTFCGCGIYIVRYFGALAVERISFYFMAGQLIALPAMLRNFTKNSKNILLIIIIILNILLFLYRLNGSELIPYRFFWE